MLGNRISIRGWYHGNDTQQATNATLEQRNKRPLLLPCSSKPTLLTVYYTVDENRKHGRSQPAQHHFEGTHVFNKLTSRLAPTLKRCLPTQVASFSTAVNSP